MEKALTWRAFMGNVLKEKGGELNLLLIRAV
jgi:hypothetical protein